MQIKGSYQKNQIITVICDDFDPTEISCQRLQQMLESKKFILEDEFIWQRRDFNEETKDSFEFWLSQVTKLCEKYGSEPVEVAVSGATSPFNQEENDSPLLLQGVTNSILLQINELKEEIATLKKFDFSAREKLFHLNELLQRKITKT